MALITVVLTFFLGLAGGWLLAARKLAVAREDLATLTVKLEERENSAGREQDVHKNALANMEINFSALANKA